MVGWRGRRYCGLTAVAIGVASIAAMGTPTVVSAPPANRHSESAPLKPFVVEHCLGCHAGSDAKGGLVLDGLVDEPIAAHAKVWEKVVRRLSSRQMPPLGNPRPDEAVYATVVESLERELDHEAAQHPDPGRTPTLRRLNRTEYHNAIHDLLALDIDAPTLLPADESNRGFDSAPLGGLSPTLLERYLAAAQKISRLAVGRPPSAPNTETFRVPGDVTQERHVDGLPLGTRGGLKTACTFPQDGDYDVQVWLTRDRNEQVEGLKEPHELVVLLDRKQVASFTVRPSPDNEVKERVDAKLKGRVAASAGPHELAVTFVQNGAALLETKRQPYEARFNLHRHPRSAPAVYQVTVTGPFNWKGRGETPSRRRVFVRQPNGPSDEEDCATTILSALMRRAYRRTRSTADVDKAMGFYREGRKGGDFDAGIEAALASILVNPQFLFRIERDPPSIAAKSVYRVNDFDLASRLSFFLWSTIPDDELLELAARKELAKSEVFEKQVRRMLADERTRNLATNFAVQWLRLRTLDALTPDLRLFPDFDDNLRQAFRKETELFVESVVREDRSVLELLEGGHTFLNERLAKHYGVPHVYGDRFRRIDLESGMERGGLLRQGSVLTTTSYATRTSPVLRGKWILETLLGAPPPPPPGNVGTLDDNMVSADLPVRERLAKHRKNASCASCHRLIDPVGFALEPFDAVGRRRVSDEGRTIDAAGGLPDGSAFDGVDGLEKALLHRPELFVRTLTEKLFTFALGRAPEEADAPAIRKIVRDAKANGYRFSSVVVGLATSAPFQMRRAE